MLPQSQVTHVLLTPVRMGVPVLFRVVVVIPAIVPLDTVAIFVKLQ